MCIAVSVVGKPFNYQIPKQLPSLSPTQVNLYLKENIDPVISFHQQPKAGSKSGAKIIKVISNARPADVVSLGYGVLMEYPPVDSIIHLSPQATLGTQLVESAMIFASKHNFPRIRVLTRPVGLLAWALKEKHG